MSKKNKLSEAQVVLCIFKTYETKPYFTSLNLIPGDKVIIETAKGKYKVVEVFQTTDIDRQTRRSAQKWIVDKVDLTEYLARKKRLSEEKKVLSKIN